jgi:hypothetical protein
MKAWILFVTTLCLSSVTMAQQQLAVRLNEQGILKILKMAVKYNSSSKDTSTLLIPSNVYALKIPKAKITENPIVPLVNEISDLNLNSDIEFFLSNSEIKITGQVDQQSLKTKISNSHDYGFDLKLSLSIPSLAIEGDTLAICEDRLIDQATCGDGLKAKFNNVKVVSRKAPIHLSATLRLKTDSGVARVSVLQVESNLDHADAPELDISFENLEVPKISIVVNGAETELNTSKLKNEIIKRKEFLAQKLLSFASNFIANDLAEMVNIYLINKQVATSFEIFNSQHPVKFDEFLSQRQYPLKENAQALPSLENKNVQLNPMSTMIGQISEIIRSAQLGISLQRIATPGDKDIEFAGLISFMLNGRTINVRNTLGNSGKTLPKLDFSQVQGSDINLAISEPLINGALDVANSTKLFQQIFEKVAPIKGISIRNVKLHFSGTDSIVAVVNAKVDLKLLESKGLTSWVKNRIAVWLERNNNNSEIYFPVEVTVIPIFRTLPNGGTGLDLKVLSPFSGTSLKNSFNYPTNVPLMTETVREAVMKELQKPLEPHTNKTYSIDVTKFLNQAGVSFFPRNISISQSAYLTLGLDILDIKFNANNPNLR